MRVSELNFVRKSLEPYKKFVIAGTCQSMLNLML